MYFLFNRKFLLLVIIFIGNIRNVIGQTSSIAQYIQTTNNLSTLSQILSDPRLINLFTLFNSTTGIEQITLFAPTDEALFSSGINLTDVATVTNLISYHTVSEKKILSKDLTPNLVANTLLNDTSLVQLPNRNQVLYLTKSSQGDITINNGNTPVKIIQMDIECSNGVIHLIDNVIVPPRSLIDTANNLDLSQFIREFSSANFLSSINSIMGITIFVPTNDAFSKSNIFSMSPEEKNSLLRLHVVNAVIYEIKDGVNTESNAVGKKLRFKVKDGSIYVNNGKVEKSVVLLQNGVMHIVDSVLLPLEDNKPDEGQGGNRKMDKKLIIGTVLGAICGGIVISLFSCMLFKWYKAQKNGKPIITNNNNKL